MLRYRQYGLWSEKGGINDVRNLRTPRRTSILAMGDWVHLVPRVDAFSVYWPGSRGRR